MTHALRAACLLPICFVLALYQPVAAAAECSASSLTTLRNCVANIANYSGIVLTQDVTCTTDVDCCGSGNSPLIDLVSTTGKTVRGDGTYRVLKRSAGQRNCSLIRAGTSTTIRDLVIDEDVNDPPCSPGDGCPSTVMVNGRHNVTLDNVRIFNGKAYVVYVWGSDRFTFRNGEITSAGIIGLYVGHNSYAPSDHLTIENSTFRWARTNAIAIEGVRNSAWDASWISGNQIYQNHLHGLWTCEGKVCPGGQIYLARGEGLVLYNNNIWGGRCDNCAGGISGIEFGDPYGGVTVNNVTVSTNRIHDNTGAGVPRRPNLSRARRGSGAL
ncbi:right-handed parallel beta-helix repeat-containing protein [Thiocystis violacea]|uniref:right-handed parallel beta-helix repeat-containing protein n=1 Tax=Thiocystis violacea TaxID=13725 RepID=UPI001906163D|nr:right-handed parallel beta-helix repeat-containing protein [Thiocystis violacea]MBK1724787.1 hypothetical protein [Thiocystis violacea]